MKKSLLLLQKTITISVQRILLPPVPRSQSSDTTCTSIETDFPDSASDIITNANSSARTDLCYLPGVINTQGFPLLQGNKRDSQDFFFDTDNNTDIVQIIPLYYIARQMYYLVVINKDVKFL